MKPFYKNIPTWKLKEIIENDFSGVDGANTNSKGRHYWDSREEMQRELWSRQEKEDAKYYLTLAIEERYQYDSNT